MKELAGELVVYDRRSNEAHCLNATAALVWRRCDGERSARAIAAELGVDEKVVAFALEELGRAELLERAPAARSGVSRREALRLMKIGAAGLALPLVQSVLAPSVAEAASCLPKNGVGCNQGGHCCPGLTCTSTTRGHCK